LRPSELLMALSDWVFVETTIWIMAFLTAYKEVKILSKYLVRAARRTLLLLIYRRQKQNKNYLWGWGEQKHKKRKKILSTFLSSNDSNLSFRRKQSSNFIIANCKTCFFLSILGSSLYSCHDINCLIKHSLRMNNVMWVIWVIRAMWVMWVIWVIWVIWVRHNLSSKARVDLLCLTGLNLFWIDCRFVPPTINGVFFAFLSQRFIFSA
jgi:hypothetical protein